MRMLWLLTRRALGRGLVGFLVLLLGVVLFEAVQAPVVASFGGARGISALIDSLPPGFQALARTRPEFSAMSGLAGSLAAGFSHPLFILLTLSAVVGFAARSLAGEMERGTILIALARPLSRRVVYGSRVIGLIIIALLLSLAAGLGLLLGVALARPEGELVTRNIAVVSVAAFLLFWAIGGLALLVSGGASTTGRVIAWGISFIVVSYFVDYFATLWSFLQPFEGLSVFHYFDPTPALAEGVIPARNVIVLSIVGLVGVVAGLAWFERRDLPSV